MTVPEDRNPFPLKAKDPNQKILFSQFFYSKVKVDCHASKENLLNASPTEIAPS